VWAATTLPSVGRSDTQTVSSQPRTVPDQWLFEGSVIIDDPAVLQNRSALKSTARYCQIRL